MQQEYEENRLMFELQKKRIEIRVEKRRQFNAARTIQHAWNGYVKRCWILYQQNCAARILQNFIADVATTTRKSKHHASIVLQRTWRAYSIWQFQTAAAKMIQCCIRQFLTRKFQIQCDSARRIQLAYRWHVKHLRDKAARSIQKHARMHRQRKKLQRLSRVYEHVEEMKKLNRAARLIQVSMGKYLVRQTIVENFQLEPISMELNQEEIQQHAREELKKRPRIRLAVLKEAMSESQRLLKEEKIMREEIKELEKQILLAKSRKQDEIQKFRRVEQVEKRKDAEMNKELIQYEAEIEQKIRQKIRMQLMK